jgi:hypothetical protein
MKNKIIILAPLVFGLSSKAQLLPSLDENIPYLVTFSKEADKSWGDDDNIQIYFLTIPQSRTEPIYIRIFDPNNGGKIDENQGGFNSKTNFSLYGGKLAHSNPDAKKQDPTGNYKSGVMLGTKTFGDDADYDEKWYSFGPFNPAEGELQPDYGGYVFKLIVEGLEGDDGNLYKISISSKKDENTAIEGGNAFAYEYCFRTNDKPGSVSHIYPFVPKGVVSVKVNTFDYDGEGIVRIISVAKKGELVKLSTDANWVASEHKIIDLEINTSLDIQLVKKNNVNNNNLVVYVTNQYGELMPFYAAPIGGIPKFSGKVVIKPTK